MQIKDLQVGAIIEFAEQINDFGGYAEKGVRARVDSVEQRDIETIMVCFNYTGFVEHNKTAESPGYGKDNDLKTATQAGVVPPAEEFAFSPDTEVDEFFSIIDIQPGPSRSVPRP